MRGMILRAVPVAALVAASACATAGNGPAGERGEERVERAERYVVVNNTSWDNVRVYALRHNVKMRLGMVAGKTTETFNLQGGMISAGGRLQLLLVPTASAHGYVMDVIPMGESRALRLDLDRRLDRSTYALLGDDGR